MSEAASGFDVGREVGREALMLVVDASPFPVIGVDRSSRIAMFNEAAERLFGYARGELLGEGLERLVPQASKSLHGKLVATYLGQPTKRAMASSRTIVGVRKDGTEVQIEVGLSPLDLSWGRFVLATVIDITERKRGEDLRARSAEFGQHALASTDVERLKLEAAELVMSSIDAQLVRVGELDASKSVLTFTAGAGPEHLLENHTLEVAASPQAAACVRSGRPTFVGASAMIPIRGNDAVIGLLHVDALEGNDFSQDDVAFLAGIGTVVGTAMDRDRRDRRIRALNVELQHRYDELESFSYSVAHDLRAPLRAVSGFAAALEEDYAEHLDSEAHRFIGLIADGAAQMGGLIDAMLSLARVSRQEITRTEIDLSALAQDIVSGLQSGEPERRVLAFVAPGAVVEGDPALLRNVLANLLGNAWKFTRGRDPALVRFEVRTAANETVYAVSDNGIGFVTERPDELFAPFKRLHGKSFEGTGIGLATVARIVHRHGGRVWAETQPEAGSTFFFTLGDLR